MAKQIEFTSKNVKPFTNWLKRFSLIDNTLLLEIDEKEQKFIAKSYNEERSVIKLSSISFDDAGFTTKKVKDPKRIKVGIYNIQRLSKVIDLFTNNDFTFIFNYDEVINETDSDYACLNIKIANKTLKMTVECTSLNIFKYLSDEMFKTKIATTNELVKFKLSKEKCEEISSLCNLDNDDKYMKFSRTNDLLEAKGKSFDLTVDEFDVHNEDVSIDIDKSQYEKLDAENYLVILGDDRLIFTSTDTDTITVISMVEKD